jgi:hypothetical protein
MKLNMTQLEAETGYSKRTKAGSEEIFGTYITLAKPRKSRFVRMQG